MLQDVEQANGVEIIVVADVGGNGPERARGESALRGGGGGGGAASRSSSPLEESSTKSASNAAMKSVLSMVVFLLQLYCIPSMLDFTFFINSISHLVTGRALRPQEVRSAVTMLFSGSNSCSPRAAFSCLAVAKCIKIEVDGCPCSTLFPAFVGLKEVVAV